MSQENAKIEALLLSTMESLEEIETSHVFLFQAKLNKLIEETMAKKVGIKNYVGEKNAKNARNKLLILDVINRMKMKDVAAKYCIGAHSVHGYYEKFWQAFFKSKGWDTYNSTAEVHLADRYVYRKYDDKEMAELINFANEYF